MERAGLSKGFILEEGIAQMIAELSAEQGIDDLQIISLDDPNIKEIVGAEAIAGRAYHTGDGVVVIVADNIEDFASAIGTITEEGRHVYHRNNNGMEDSEDYASFYGEQFKNCYNRVAGDTPLVMIGSELGYNAGQLGNDWEDDVRLSFVVATGEVGKYVTLKGTHVLGIAEGDNGETRFYYTKGTGIGVGLGAGVGVGIGSGFLSNTDNPEDIKGKGNSVSINFTGVISISGSADFSDGSKNAGFSGSVGTGGGEAASFSYVRGTTVVAKTVPELLVKIAIPNEQLREAIITEFEKLVKKRGKKWK